MSLPIMPIQYRFPPGVPDKLIYHGMKPLKNKMFLPFFYSNICCNEEKPFNINYFNRSLSHMVWHFLSERIYMEDTHNTCSFNLQNIRAMILFANSFKLDVKIIGIDPKIITVDKILDLSSKILPEKSLDESYKISAFLIRAHAKQK